jgi:RND family efflux transporter MFP subunit
MTPYDHSSTAFDMRDTTPAPAKNVGTGSPDDRARLARRIGWGAGGVLVAALLVGAALHYSMHHEAVAVLQAHQQAVPQVRVEPVKVTSSPRDLSLPGTTMAFESATIFARQSGYVGERRVDIGSKVKAGDVLAIITAPEIDDQLNQARAQLLQMQASLKQAQANHGLAIVTDRRTAELVKQGWQSKQQGDTDKANLDAQSAAVNVAQANISAQQAQVARLVKEQAYEQVIAPFDGVITQRSIDTGSLVTADSTSGSSMFAIERTNVLRVQIDVPQDAVPGLKDGVAADVTVPEFPGRVFTGHVARTAEALQAGTRTLLVEVDVDNADGALAAGVYCTVKFEVPRANPVLQIPADALIFNRDGTQVAVYQDGKAHIRKVSLAEDDGDHVDIATGLQPNDRVIVSLPVDLVDGAPVAVRDMKAQTAKAGS